MVGLAGSASTLDSEVLAVTVTLGETSSGEVMDGHALTVQVGRAAS